MRTITRAVTVLLMATSCANSGQTPNDPTGQPPAVPSGWQTFNDADYGFAIDFPPEYVIQAESAQPPDSRPPALRRVRFQRRDIAAGQFADREPAKFTIEVFERIRSHALREWLQSAGRLAAGAVVTAVGLQGAQEGVRITMRQLLAPNDFVYFAKGDYVYALTPLGEHGERMLASFRFVGG
jgi:hypothetical protein